MCHCKNFLLAVSGVLLLWIWISGCGIRQNSPARIIRVATETRFREAVHNAAPGAVIVAADGDYRFDDAPLRITNIRGTAESPVLIRAEHLLQARFTGEYALLLENCSYVTVEGFSFLNRAAKHTIQNALSSADELGANRDEAPFWGSLVMLNCDHCRFTRLFVRLDEDHGLSDEQRKKLLPRLHWLNLTGGGYNRVDHCRFRGKRNSGVTLVTGIGEHHFRIDANHFDGRPRGLYNGFESIRLGTGDLTRLWGIIEGNLFENCDGEDEIISVKASVLRITGNTFRDCRGTLCIRHANHITIDHNFFLNPSGKPNVHGVRVHGSDNNILNNYFGDLTGNGLTTFWGDYEVPGFDYHDAGWFDYDFGAREYSYRRSSRVQVAYNTWANCARFLDFGKYQKRDVVDQSLPPRDWSFLNNLVVVSDSTFIRGEGETGTRWAGNLFWNPKGICITGRDLPELSVRVTDPKLIRDSEGLWRPAPDSPAVDSAEKTMWYWLHWVDASDMDGQERDLNASPNRPMEFKTDIGADEVSDAPKKSRPLTAADVGPEGK
jgi:poly(beta-D-mannuronate) lyase